MKQYIRNDFLSLDEKISLEISNLSFPDVYFFEKSKNKVFLTSHIIIEYIKEIAMKYKINLEYIAIFKIIKSILLINQNDINHKSLASNLSFIIANYIEEHYNYSKLASACLIEFLFQDISDFYFDSSTNSENYEELYKNYFKKTIAYGIQENIFSTYLEEFDLVDLANYLQIERDNLFDYMGVYTLYKRYFIKDKKKETVLELPQAFWMRIAMGLSIHEKDKNEKAKEFYDLFSSLRYIPSTPTLCHSGFTVPQLSSCYLQVVEDDLHDIFTSYRDSAQLAKWSGGIGTSWSKIRACGAHIKKINLDSQGVIPYLKIEDDIISSISKTGTRRGGKAVYLDIWHYDVEDFLDLKKNTGDHRRRTHDLNTALWISDLFMERVIADESWTLFSPDEVPLLLEKFGVPFNEAYKEYEQLVTLKKIKLYKTISAKELWKIILTRIFETGHPWITFKDPCNIRSPQKHCGIIHSSNLCTEITLNTSKEETAVCNIGSLNLARHVDNESGEINFSLLKKTIDSAVRCLDNVIDITFYPVKSAENANITHRPIGLGLMGWQDILFKKKLSFESEETAKLSNSIMEYISYQAISASIQLAQERGQYKSFKNSLWDQGIFPSDTVELLNSSRKTKLITSEIKKKLDWNFLKKEIQQNGIRNSNIMAIAPTATISTIAGCFPSIEPIYKNLYAKSNITGEFSIVNKYLIDELISLDLWSEEIIKKIKFHDGSIQNILEIPEEVRNRFKTAFEIDQKKLIDLTALRGQWIDQSQSHNIFFAGTSGKLLDEIYLYAWKKGLKTTYYLRTIGKSQIEKATLGTEYGLTQIRTAQNKNSCQIDNKEGCESCQ